MPEMYNIYTYTYIYIYLFIILCIVCCVFIILSTFLAFIAFGKDKAPTDTPTDAREDEKKEPTHESDDEDKDKTSNGSTQEKDALANANGDTTDKHIIVDSVDNETGNETETETEVETTPQPGETSSNKDENADMDTNGTDEERAQLIESFLELKEPQLNWKMVEFFAKTS
ncbi:Signal recognition particle GTPase, FtsY [Reticulomyxa filosa]|uniref:Signal recognition particle GTPase, FtsY n=1 Tax=Reticulomyxa filosa TaxID=46433 RepID=X6P5I5_RETFI|nr:Signal recognition particle GTPase, FtsY [Reticulomyxa filosa]|eukprot:ETO33815.1 Signal recognition particle GTPase, FtsY [Reticulomyxa filosa]